MLQGVVPFPAEFSRRYRARGYWSDKSLAQEFKVVFERYADRVAIIDRRTRRLPTRNSISFQTIWH